MEADRIGPGQLKAKQVVDNKLVERLQEKRRPPEGRAVEPLALLVAHRPLDDLDAKLRPGCVHSVGRIFEVPEKSINGLAQLFAGDLCAVPDALRVL